MWFGSLRLLSQSVLGFDEEIILYSWAHIPLICILKSSPVFELCGGRNFPSSVSGLFSLEEGEDILNLEITHQKCFDNVLIITDLFNSSDDHICHELCFQRWVIAFICGGKRHNNPAFSLFFSCSLVLKHQVCACLMLCGSLMTFKLRQKHMVCERSRDLGLS